MRALTLVFGFAIALAISAASPSQAQDADIRSVITSQIEAFKADDFDTAFTFAAPSIQNMFRTPQNFGRMVSQGYPMVWRPAEVDYLDLRRENGGIFQDVEITDSDGARHLLEYRMTETDGVWKISGVRILQAPGVAA